MICLYRRTIIINHAQIIVPEMMSFVIVIFTLDPCFTDEIFYPSYDVTKLTGGWCARFLNCTLPVTEVIYEGWRFSRLKRLIAVHIDTDGDIQNI